MSLINRSQTFFNILKLFTFLFVIELMIMLAIDYLNLKHGTVILFIDALFISIATILSLDLLISQKTVIPDKNKEVDNPLNLLLFFVIFSVELIIMFAFYYAQLPIGSWEIALLDALILSVVIVLFFAPLLREKPSP